VQIIRYGNTYRLRLAGHRSRDTMYSSVPLVSRDSDIKSQSPVDRSLVLILEETSS
jgi:hypothetical protein